MLLQTTVEPRWRNFAFWRRGQSAADARAYGDIAGSTPHDDLRASLLERARRVAAGCAGHLPKDELVRREQRLAAIETKLATAD
jgi:hypothetical protein